MTSRWGSRSIGALLAVMVFAPNAAALQCEARQGGGSGWSWREIDGQRCWYRGHRRMSKGELYWAPPPEPRSSEKNAPAITPAVPWGALLFNERFGDGR